MGSIQNATENTVRLIPSAVLVVVGSLAATVVTDVGKNNIYDVGMKGGDALYPVVTATLLNAFVGGSKTVRLASVGMVSSSVTTFAKAYGLV